MQWREVRSRAKEHIIYDACEEFSLLDRFRSSPVILSHYQRTNRLDIASGCAFFIQDQVYSLVMTDLLHKLRSRRIGLALSGGSVRGLAHIGIIKVLAEVGIRPAVIVGTSAGSLIGAAAAAEIDWERLRQMACEVFWPSLLTRSGFERFCSIYLPATFHDLKIPFAAVATSLPDKRPVVIAEGPLASALSASCAMRLVRRPVTRNGHRLKDGGIACVLPAGACRDLGAEMVIGSDVWELSSALRSLGLNPTHPRGRHAYPKHFQTALQHVDVLLQPDIPATGYLPGSKAVDLMIEAGERAARRALSLPLASTF